MSTKLFYPQGNLELEEKNIARFLSKLAFISGMPDSGPTIEKLRQAVGQEFCWIWIGQCYKRRYFSKRDPVPTRIYRVPFLKTNVETGVLGAEYARPFAYWLIHGHRIPKGYIVKNRCGEEMCVHPHKLHNEVILRAEMNIAPQKPGGRVFIDTTRKVEEFVPSPEDFLKKPH